MMSSIAVAGAFMAALGTLLAWLLAVANKRLYVYEDPRIGEVEELLPKSNCGACGTAGCRNFAEQVVAGEIVPAKCTVNSPDMNAYIASFLGVAMGDVEKQVARLACAGGSHVAYVARQLQGPGHLPRGGHRVRRRQGLRLGLPGPGRLRGGVRLRRHRHEPIRPPGRGCRQVHRLRRLRRRVPQRPFLACSP